MKPLFLSQSAEDGFNRLREDLQRLRERNKEAIPERHLRILDRLQQLSYVVVTVVISVAVIYVVWTILNSTGINAVTQMIQWAIDLLKLARVMA